MTEPGRDDSQEALRTGALAPLAAGSVVAGRYRLDAQLGAGGFGAVWRAHNLDLGRDVALKLLHPELARDPGLQQRFLREVDVATRFVHRYAVQVRDAGRDPARGLLYLTMDLVGGPTLGELLKAGPLQPARAARLVAQTLEALGEAHRAGLVHRDIKPANLMVCRGHGGEEEVRVLDFGIARAFDRASEADGVAIPTLTAAGAVIGTVAYMSPEQAQGLRVDARSDLYSLGVTLYQALSGRFPHEPDAQAASSGRSLLFKIVADPPRDLGEVAPQVPAALRAVVMRALAKSPAERWPDAASFAAALRAACEPAEPPTTPPTDAATITPARVLADAPTLEPPGSGPPEKAPEEVPEQRRAGGPPGHDGPPPARAVRPFGDVVLRVLATALGAAPVGGVVGAALVLASMAVGLPGRAEEIPVVGGVCAVLGVAVAVVVVGMEELARLARRPRLVWLGLLLVGVLLVCAVAGILAAGGALAGNDLPIVSTVAALVALPLVPVGLARLGGAWPGAGPAPLLRRWQLLLALVAGGVVWALQAGPLQGALAIAYSGPAEVAGSLVLILGFTCGGVLALLAGDVLARRWGLDPRPAAATGPRGLGCLAWVGVLTLSLLTLAVTRGFEVGLDLRRPRIVIDEPADYATVGLETVLLHGRVEDGGPVTLALEPMAWDPVGRVEILPDPGGEFGTWVTLRPGHNLIRLVATDEAGNQAEQTWTIWVQSPEPPVGKDGK